MPCPSPSITPTFLYCSPPRTLSSPVSLSVNYSLSFLSFPLLVQFDGVSSISVLHLLSRTSFCPDIPLTHTSSTCCSAENRWKLGSSHYILFLCFHLFLLPHTLYLFQSLFPLSLFSYNILPGPLLICYQFLSSLFYSPSNLPSALWKIRSEISLLQLPHCWVKPNAT